MTGRQHLLCRRHNFEKKNSICRDFLLRKFFFCDIILTLFRTISSVVEHFLHTEGVVGPTPTSSRGNSAFWGGFFIGFL